MNTQDTDDAKRSAAKGRLRASLAEVLRHEQSGDYDNRFRAVLDAMHHAQHAGYDVGFSYDPTQPEYCVVAYIELPDSKQMSWHMPPHRHPWNGHTTAMKYAQLSEFLDLPTTACGSHLTPEQTTAPDRP